MELDRLTIRRLSCEVPCDPRSIRKETLEPGSVKGVVGERIRAVLRERGIAPKVPTQPERRA